jgi:hypothetical protein
MWSVSVNPLPKETPEISVEAKGAAEGEVGVEIFPQAARKIIAAPAISARDAWH